MKVTRHNLVGTVAELRAAMEQADAEDEQAEGRIRVGRSRMYKGVLFSAFAIGIPVLLWAEVHPLAGLLTLVAGLPVAGWGIWTISVARGQVKEAEVHDLDDAKVQTLRKLLQLLAADVPAKARLRLDVDFRGAALGEFVDPAASQGKQVWRQPWLVLKGRFADGTHWRLTLERRMSRKRKPKSKGRVKITERLRDRLVLDVKVDPKRYGDLTALPQRTPPPPPPLQVLAGTAQGTRARAVLATPVAQSLTVRGSTSHTGHELLAGPEVLLSSLVWLYRGLSTLRV